MSPEHLQQVHKFEWPIQNHGIYLSCISFDFSQCALEKHFFVDHLLNGIFLVKPQLKQGEVVLCGLSLCVLKRHT